jgi:hypothetical protein
MDDVIFGRMGDEPGIMLVSPNMVVDFEIDQIYADSIIEGYLEKHDVQTLNAMVELDFYRTDKIFIPISTEQALRIPHFKSSNLVTIAMPSLYMHRFINVVFNYDEEFNVFNFAIRIDTERFLKQWGREGYPTIWRLGQTIPKQTEQYIQSIIRLNS